MAAIDDPESFKRALATYTKRLNKKQRKSITMPTSLSDLVSQAESISADSRNKSSIVRSLGRAAMKLEPFEKFVEGACKMSPVARDLIWGSVSFILQMVKDEAKAFNTVIEFVSTMAEEVEKARLEERTFPDSPLVRSAAEALYAAILDFWVKAVIYYRLRHSGCLKKLKAVVFSSSIEKDFQELMRVIEKQRSKLDQVAGTVSRQEVKEHNRTDRQKRLKEWLNCPNYRGDLETANGRRLEGTCKWLEEKPDFKEWKTSASRHSLFIVGTPGTGKTILCTYVIKEVPSNTLVLYHYFQNAQHPTSAIRSFIDQLFNHLWSTNHPHLSDLVLALDKALVQHTPHTDYSHLWSIFAEAISALTTTQPSEPITIVVDALDECAPTLLPRITTDLLTLAEHCQKIKILMTGRKSAWDLVSLKYPASSPLCPLEFEITPNDIKEDIWAFVDHSIHGITRLTDENELKEHLCNSIGNEKNHEGMFLWVSLMCREAQSEGNVSVLRKLLNRLPKGLDALYGQICKNIIERSETHESLSLPVLKWIAHSPQSLRFSELKEGLRLMDAQDPRNSSGDSDWTVVASKSLWSREDIVNAGGNLVLHTGPEGEDTFRLIHLSANQFFSDRSIQSRLPSDVQPFVEEVWKSKAIIGRLCLDYLRSNTLRSHPFLSSFDSYLPATSRLCSNHENNFLEQYPLFKFAVLQWPTFLIDCLRSPAFASCNLTDFLQKAKVFILDPFGTLWKECFIRQSSKGFLMDTIEQISQQLRILGSAQLIEFNTSMVADLTTIIVMMHPLDVYEQYPTSESAEPSLRMAHQVSSILIKIFGDFQKYEKFLAYRNEPAKDLLDLLQKLLDHASLEPRFRVILYVALVRLCRRSELYPRCFSLTDVHVDSGIPLSNGTFGDIYKGQYNGRTVCVKAFRLFQTSNRPALEKAYSREAVVWGQLSHPNILPFYGVHRLNGHNQLCLVSPWMENGNIKEFLNTPARSQLDRTSLISDIASGMKYLHDNGVVHGDLKSLNILVTESERACLADFGFSHVTELGGLVGLALSSHPADGGTRDFEAPELVKSDGSKKTSASDVFAFAMMVCFEIFTGQLPFGGIKAAPFKIQSGERPERPTSQVHVQRGLTDAMWALMEKCWSQLPEDRPTAAQILQILPPVETSSRPESWEWTRNRGPGFETSDATITRALSHLQPLL